MPNPESLATPLGSPLSSRVTLVTLDGAVVVKKEHPSSSAARSEAQWLAAAPARGVVRLIDHGATTTTTEHVPGPTLRTAELIESQAATVMISLARTVAELEDRDMVHGAIAPDHVIVRGNDAVLCSPAKPPLAPRSGSQQPTPRGLDHLPAGAHADVRGLRLCVTAIRQRWEEQGQAPTPSWTRLEELLDSDNPPSPRRVARAMAPLARRPEPDRRQPNRRRSQPKDGSPSPHRSPTGALAVAFFVAVALAGLWFTRSDDETELGPHQIITIDRQKFGVGSASDVAVGLDQRCRRQPAAVMLDDADIVWIFTETIDGAEGQRAMTVPGASDLEVSTGPDGCPTVVVSGPAGRTELDWAGP